MSKLITHETGSGGFFHFLRIAVSWKFLLPLFLLTVPAFAGTAFSATYYSSPSGSGTTCSSASPCSLTTGVGVLRAGDTLYLLNGTYNSSINLTSSGTSTAPITIKAANDGQAIVDGQGVRTPCQINYQSYIDVEGIVFKNSKDAVVVVQYSNNITMRRVSGYNTADGNYHIFDYYHVSNSLIEECIAGGRHRVEYDMFECNAVTIRRSFGRFEQGVTYASGGFGIQLYGATNCIAENNVLEKDPAYTNVTYGGIQIWSNTYNSAANYNQVYGNVVIGANDAAFVVVSAEYLLTGNHFKDNVAINTNQCFAHAADNSLMVENLTCVSATPYQYYMLSDYQYYTLASNFAVAGTLKNSSFLSGGTGIYYSTSDPYYRGLSHVYNNLYSLSGNYGGSAGQGTGETSSNPGYNTGTYGKGAYLMVPSALQGKGQSGADMGAKVLYRYQNGTLSTTPLWPWPTESRVSSEIGVGVTSASNGGIWSTLSGVYSSTPTSTGDTTPPSVPAGLAATAISSSQINLLWTASTDNVGVAGYKIYRNGTQVATTTTPSYSNTGLTASTTYSYTVSAYDAAGNVSSLSAPISATTLATADTTAPSVPTGLAAKVASASQINLSWTASTDNVGVAGYKIYRNGTQVGTASTPSYSDTGLQGSTTYSYTVAAYDAAGNTSAQSAAVSAVTTTALASSSTPAPVIVDNGGTGTSYTGAWYASSSTGYYGTNSLYGSAGASYTWHANLPVSGGYQVYVWWTAFSNRSTNAPYTITYNGGTKTVAVNQQQSGGQWVYMGTYDFTSAQGGTVTLNTPGSYPTTYSADAVKFVYAPFVVVDDQNSGTSYTGAWYASTAAGFYGANSLYGSAGASYTWNATLPVSGTYNVYAWWTAFSNRSTSVPYTINYNGGSTTVSVNQQQNGGQWNYLGTFTFDASKGGQIVLKTPGNYPTTYDADAVMFALQP